VSDAERVIIIIIISIDARIASAIGFYRLVDANGCSSERDKTTQLMAPFRISLERFRITDRTRMSSGEFQVGGK